MNRAFTIVCVSLAFYIVVIETEAGGCGDAVADKGNQAETGRLHHDDPVIALRRQGGLVSHGRDGLTVRYRGLDRGLQYLKLLPQIHTLDLARSELTDDGLHFLAELSGVRNLFLSETKATDEGLKHLAGLTSVKVLDLTGTKVTGTGFQHLIQMQKLEILRLNGLGGRLSPAGLPALKGLKNLRHLEMRSTKIDASVIKQLKQLPALTSFSFNEEIEAATLEEIKSFAQLKNLEGGLSNAQAAELYEARPDLNVYNP